MPYPASARPSSRRTVATLALLGCCLLTACTGGTPWGATPQRLDLPIPDLTRVPQVLDGASGSTSGALRVAERVRQALNDPTITVDGFEGGLIVLGGRPADGAARQRAIETARGVAGVSQVVDRMTTP